MGIGVVIWSSSVILKIPHLLVILSLGIYSLDLPVSFVVSRAEVLLVQLHFLHTEHSALIHRHFHSLLADS